MLRRDFSRQLAGAGLGLAVTGLAQAQGAPKEGTHYVRLSTPAPVTLPTTRGSHRPGSKTTHWVSRSPT